MSSDPLATIVTDPEPTTAPEATETLELMQTLGEGGMGAVWLGRQRRLERLVAVKRAHADIAGATDALITEALVTGGLEHPNIVPVYDLHHDDAGPAMVMKRLDGIVWTELIDEPDRVKPMLDGRTELAFHIDVLLAVCRAVRFAHSRGIVHRDLKTDNVMIGEFGEITLLDWGLAVSLREEDRGRIPLASQVSKVAGTPAYMAPEMARPRGAIDERTDVYLLGATLHLLLTGRPRHDGDGVRAVLDAARVSAPPRFPPDVSPHLGEICARATSARPEDRYPDVQAFQDALIDYRHHLSSIRLATVARRRAAIHRGLVERELAGEPQDATSVNLLSIEARFGFHQAIDEWADNAEAHRGIEDVARWTARYCLHRGNPDAARAAMEDLSEPDPELEAELIRVTERRALEDRAADELERLAWERDLRVFAGRRGAVIVALGCAVALLCALVAALDRTGLWPIGHLEMAVGTAAFATSVFLATGIAGRFASNEAGRVELRSLRVIAAMVFAHWLGAAWMGVAIPEALALHTLLAGAMLVTVGSVYDRAAVFSGLAYVFAWAGIALLPGFAFEIFGLGNVASYAVFALWTGTRMRPAGSRTSAL